MITERNVARHELIGLPVRVARSSDPSLIGAAGRVVDETRNMLALSHDAGGRKVWVPKQGCTFQFSLPGGKSASIDGNDISFRPEDRVKRCR